MRIESVSAKADRVGRFRVQFGDGSVLRLYRQTVEDFGLCSGQELTDEQFERLRQNAADVSAKMRAVRVVAACAVSEKDLEHRLIQKGEDPHCARQAVQWLQEHDLLDDAQTARQIVSRCAAKGYGLARAKQALYEKKIPKQFWEEALADYPDQAESVVAYLRARLAPDADQREIRRVTDALLRRGHSYGDIRKALAVWESEHSED